MSERRRRRLLCRHPGGPRGWALLALFVALLVSSLAPIVHAEAAAWGATSTSLTRSAPVTLLSQHPDHCLLCLAGQQWRAADLPGEARPAARVAEGVLLARGSDPHRRCVVRVHEGGPRAPPRLLSS